MAGDEALGLLPCPSIAGKKFKHLRKTAFTWLDRAGNDLKAIAAVSGQRRRSSSLTWLYHVVIFWPRDDHVWSATVGHTSAERSDGYWERPHKSRPPTAISVPS